MLGGLTVCDPSCHNRAKVPCCVVDGSEDSTMLRVNKLRNQQRCSTVGNCETESDQESSTDEHLDVGGGGLQDNTNAHENATSNYANASAEVIGNVGGNGKGHNRTNGLDGNQQADHGGLGVVES